MPSPSAQSRIDRNSYIPPHVEQAMTQHMQQNLPAHLKKYVGSNTYVPQHAQAAIANSMQAKMPGHLKQYSGAYMQQKVVQPNHERLRPVAPVSTSPSVNPALPDQLRRGHSMPVGQQYDVDPKTLDGNKALFQSEPAASAPPDPQPGSTYSPGQQQGPHHPTYDFIMNPADQPPKKPKLGGSGTPLIVRIGLAAAGLLILLIAFTFVRGMLNGGSNLGSFVTIAQKQQQMIHLLDGAEEQQNLSVSGKNFVATADLSLNTSQTQLIEYLTKNGQKVNDKQLSLKISPSLDSRLETAVAATTYEETFKEIMQTQLEDYMSDLQQTYQQTKGEKGRALLDKDYKQAQLLLELLKAGDQVVTVAN